MSGAARGPRGPYAKSAALRAKILEVALEIFGELGYRATTMKAIAERAGISQRGLVHHFPSKEDVLAGVLADYDDSVAQSLPRAQGIEGLRALVSVTAKGFARPGIIELYSILSTEAAAVDHPAHDHYRHRYEVFRKYLVACLDESRARDMLRTGLDSETLAIMFTGLMDGLQSQWLYDNDGIDIEHSLNQFIDEFLVARD